MPDQAGKGRGRCAHGARNLYAGPTAKTAEARDDTATHMDELEYVRQMAVKSVPTIDFSQNIRNFAGLRAVAGRRFVVGESEIPNFINAARIKSPRAFFHTRNRGRPCADIGRLRSRPVSEAGVQERRVRCRKDEMSFEEQGR